MIHLTINNKPVVVEDGTTILNAAKSVGISIPHLCYKEGLHTNGACRMCVVEVEGARNLQASCITTVREGMVVRTNTARVQQARRVLYDLLISNHPSDCTHCVRNQQCELQDLGNTLGITETRIKGERLPAHVDTSPSITRDTDKCILCRRCVDMCGNIQKVGAISSQNRGFNTVVSPAMMLPLESTECAMCGQCTTVCPVGALVETDGIQAVWNALQDPDKRVVVQIAPAIRAALGEEFGMPGVSVTGKLATVLRDLGFDDVFDTNFTADLTILEEGTELLHRLIAVFKEGKDPKDILPMMTSCSPGWIKHIEHAYPGELTHLSTCKSPHTMLGALVKSYYANEIKIDPKKLFVVSVMPCTAKKYEITRPEMGDNGLPDVDTVITTRELAKMIRSAGIDFTALPESQFDEPLGFSTGAADIFGVTGGVMEAALRTVYEIVSGRELPSDNLHLTPIGGFEQIREAELTFTDLLPAYSFLEGATVKVAVTSGLAGADILMDQVKAGTSPYLFIEVMGCPGGCINGGGQPIYKNRPENYLQVRRQVLMTEDEGKPYRKSHENPAIIALYEKYLGEPCGEKSHHLLHTTYTQRGRFNELL